MTMPVRNGEKFPIEVLIADVKEHALRYYNQNGWDYVVETMSDEDIARWIGKATSKYGARNRVYKVVKLWDDMRKEARSAGGEY